MVKGIGDHYQINLVKVLLNMYLYYNLIFTGFNGVARRYYINMDSAIAS